MNAGVKNSALKKLAGETVIYGTSTILARVLNFLLVPLYTRVLTDLAAYGVVAEFMAYIAVLQVILVMGLETGCFRFASLAQQKHDGKGAGKVFSTALTTVTLVAGLFFVVVVLLKQPIAGMLGYANSPQSITYVAGILFLDSITAILFARLRFEHKAIKFALFKTIKICCELGMNLLFFLWVPRFLSANPQALIGRFIPAVPDYNYVLFSIFLSCIVALVLFLPDLLKKSSFAFDRKLWGKLMLYSLPLMVAGLPGILNDFSDRLLFRFLIPEDVSWRAQMGIYQAGIKLAVLINLFIQMFRYAAEPFFFGESGNKNAPETYARVLEIFTGFCMLVYLFILLYMDLFGLILGANYREGIVVVPIMALAYVLLGIYFNISIWFKLSEKTSYAVLITTAGLAVTLLVNVLFMPRYGYMAAAWGHLASYLVMVVICALMGRKHYPIPYRWQRNALYIVAGVSLYVFSLLFAHLPLVPKLIVNTGILLLYLISWAWAEGFFGKLRKLWQQR
ncbi:MAG TPA: oligosaccharide flippase family protein [Bacteroidales bacterium]|nr:oligosaccharide flippase family protein [Bacteroidales bacterium]